MSLIVGCARPKLFNNLNSKPKINENHLAKSKHVTGLCCHNVLAFEQKHLLSPNSSIKAFISIPFDLFILSWTMSNLNLNSKLPNFKYVFFSTPFLTVI